MCLQPCCCPPFLVFMKDFRRIAILQDIRNMISRESTLKLSSCEYSPSDQRLSFVHHSVLHLVVCLEEFVRSSLDKNPPESNTNVPMRGTKVSHSNLLSSVLGKGSKHIPTKIHPMRSMYGIFVYLHLT